MLNIREIKITNIDEWVDYKLVSDETVGGSVSKDNFPNTPLLGETYYLVLSGSTVKGIAKKIR